MWARRPATRLGPPHQFRGRPPCRRPTMQPATRAQSRQRMSTPPRDVVASKPVWAPTSPDAEATACRTACLTLRSTLPSMEARALAAIGLTARSDTRDASPPSVLRILMPGPLDLPCPQRFVCSIASCRVCAPSVAQLLLQNGHASVVPAQRCLPSRPCMQITPAKREHAQPFLRMLLERSEPHRHRNRRLPLESPRVDQSPQSTPYSQVAHSHEQSPEIRLPHRTDHHARRPWTHNPRSNARVSSHSLHRSYG